MNIANEQNEKLYFIKVALFPLFFLRDVINTYNPFLLNMEQFFRESRSFFYPKYGAIVPLNQDILNLD